MSQAPSSTDPPDSGEAKASPRPPARASDPSLASLRFWASAPALAGLLGTVGVCLHMQQEGQALTRNASGFQAMVDLLVLAMGIGITSLVSFLAIASRTSPNKRRHLVLAGVSTAIAMLFLFLALPLSAPFYRAGVLAGYRRLPLTKIQAAAEAARAALPKEAKAPVLWDPQDKESWARAPEAIRALSREPALVSVAPKGVLIAYQGGGIVPWTGLFFPSGGSGQVDVGAIEEKVAGLSLVAWGDDDLVWIFRCSRRTDPAALLSE